MVGRMALVAARAAFKLAEVSENALLPAAGISFSLGTDGLGLVMLLLAAWVI